MTPQLKLRLEKLRQQLDKARAAKDFAEMILIRKQINDIVDEVWQQSKAKKDSETTS